VDVDSLPPGSSQPLHLDSAHIEYEDNPVFSMGVPDDLNLRLRCNEAGTSEIVDIHSQEVQYRLGGINCREVMAGEGVPVIAAYDPAHDLLATFWDYEIGVSIWTQRDGQYWRVLRLNSRGYALEFTEENLRARNVNGWKVYAVADILAAINEPS
jgi:hypothetical protein